MTKINYQIKLCCAAALCLLGASLPCYSAIIPLPATTSGRYFDSGVFLSGGYGTGWHSGLPGEARSFFSFNLAGVTGTIISATMHLQTAPGFGSYLSGDPTETLSLFDVSTAIASLSGGSGGIPAFTDLGTGTVFGSLVVDNTAGNSSTSR